MGLLNKLFAKKKKLEPINLDVVGVDMHSHLIPGIDDGSDSIEASVEMIRGMVELGYKKLITTPHIMSDYYKNTPEIILSGLEKVKEAVKQEGIDVSLEAAAEYYLDFGFEETLKTGNVLTFGKNHLLFEVSYINQPDNLAHMVFEMQTAGYKPVLAHPERYPFWYNTFDKYHELKEKGVLLQLNINSLTGYYSEATKDIAERMIDENLVDFIGTDTHHVRHLQLVQQSCRTEHLHKLIESGNLLNSSL